MKNSKLSPSDQILILKVACAAYALIVPSLANIPAIVSTLLAIWMTEWMCLKSQTEDSAQIIQNLEKLTRSYTDLNQRYTNLLVAYEQLMKQKE